MKHLSWDDAWELAERLPRDGTMDDTVFRHVQECTTCGHRVEHAKALIQVLQDEAKLPKSVHAKVDDDKLWEAIASRVENNDVLGETSRQLKGRPWVQAHRASSWALAAVALMIVSVGIHWYTLHNEGRPSGPAFALMQSATTSSIIHSDRATPSAASGRATNREGKNIASSGVTHMTIMHQVGSAPSVSSSLMVTPMVRGVVRVHVVGQVAGHSEPLANAHVAVLSRAGVVWSGRTGPNGSVVTNEVEVPSPQWWSAVPRGQVRDANGEATVVVWKSGYASYVEAGVPVFGNGTTSTVQVALSPSNSRNQWFGTMDPLPKSDVMALGSAWSQSASKGGPQSGPAASRQLSIEVRVTSPQDRVVPNAKVSWLTVHGVSTGRTNERGEARLSSAETSLTAVSPACVPLSVWNAAGRPVEGVFHVGTSLGTGVWVGFDDSSDSNQLAIPRQNGLASFESSESLPLPQPLVDAIAKYVLHHVKQ